MDGYKLLPRDILAKASLRGNEYAWKPHDVRGVIIEAEKLGLANLGGQPQFRIPDGTCEMYWINIDPAPKSVSESWSDYVKRTASEALTQFDKIIEETDFRKRRQNLRK